VLKGGIALTVGTASSCGRTLFAPLPDLRERKHNNDVVGSYRSPTRLRNVNWRLGPLVFLNSAPDVSISRISASRSCFGSLFFSLAALTLLALLTAIVRALRGANGGTRGSGNFGRFFASSRRCLRVHGAGGLTQSASWCMNRVFPAIVPHIELALDSRGRCGTSGLSEIIRLAGRTRFISPGYPGVAPRRSLPSQTPL
jgi:hypothetical protein